MDRTQRSVMPLVPTWRDFENVSGVGLSSKWLLKLGSRINSFSNTVRTNLGDSPAGAITSSPHIQNRLYGVLAAPGWTRIARSISGSGGAHLEAPAWVLCGYIALLSKLSRKFNTPASCFSIHLSRAASHTARVVTKNSKVGSCGGSTVRRNCFQFGTRFHSSIIILSCVLSDDEVQSGLP